MQSTLIDNRMDLCVINSILYTPDNGIIPKKESIEDTMIYNLCNGFAELGHNVTLIAANEYKPERLPNQQNFRIVFMKSCFPNIFKPTVLPLHISLYAHLKESDYDLIISSEFFSFNTLIASLIVRDRVIIWHELAKHNRLAFQLPSKIWYNIVGQFIRSKVIPRSESSKAFIKHYSSHVANLCIEHGIDLNKFPYSSDKQNTFVVLSQLIPRKRIDRIIYYFSRFVQKYPDYKLLIIGDGSLQRDLVTQSEVLKLRDKISFLGQMKHSDLQPILRVAKGLLIYTQQDNNMVSIPESIASGTPVLTNTIPTNSYYIKDNNLGIVKDDWTEADLERLVKDNSYFIESCIQFRERLSTKSSSKQFIDFYESTIGK